MFLLMKKAVLNFVLWCLLQVGKSNLLPLLDQHDFPENVQRSLCTKSELSSKSSVSKIKISLFFTQNKVKQNKVESANCISLLYYHIFSIGCFDSLQTSS